MITTCLALAALLCFFYAALASAFRTRTLPLALTALGLIFLLSAALTRGVEWQLQRGATTHNSP